MHEKCLSQNIINPKKCRFFVSSLEFLDHTQTLLAISLNGEKVNILPRAWTSGDTMVRAAVIRHRTSCLSPNWPKTQPEWVIRHTYGTVLITQLYAVIRHRTSCLSPKWSKIQPDLLRQSQPNAHAHMNTTPSWIPPWITQQAKSTTKLTSPKTSY